MITADGKTITGSSLKLGLNLMGFVNSGLDMKVLMSQINEGGSGIIDLGEFLDFCAATAQEDAGGQSVAKFAIATLTVTRRWGLFLLRTTRTTPGQSMHMNSPE